MRKSIASSFAAVLVVSALTPMTVLAQNTAAPATAPAAAAPGNTATQPGMRKFNKSFTGGNRAMMTRNNGKWRNRQVHRTMPYGRSNGTNRANWGNTGAVNKAMPNPSINNGAAVTAKQTATGAKKMHGTHRGHSGKHKATNTSAKHVARHSGSSGQNAKVTHVSHRR